MYFAELENDLVKAVTETSQQLTPAENFVQLDALDTSVLGMTRAQLQQYLAGG